MAGVLMPINKPNRKVWRVGDTVIHDTDAKERRMLRVVVFIKPSGVMRTVFKYKQELPEGYRDQIFYDWPRFLHDPNRFNIKYEKSNKKGIKNG